jgi:hypothetical protein
MTDSRYSSNRNRKPHHTTTHTNMSTPNKVILHTALIVRKMTEERSKRFGIYRGIKLLEGGFFSKGSAECAASDYRVDGEPIILA